MNAFDGLLPPPSAPPPLPHRGGAAAAVAASRARRRTRGTRVAGATGVLSLALVAVAMLQPAPALRGIVEDPTATPPTASAGPTASATPPGAGGHGVAATATAPARTAGPSSVPATPAGPRVSTLTPRPPGPPARPTRITRSVVEYNPREACVGSPPATGDDGSLLCEHVHQVEDIPYGKPFKFDYDVCSPVRETVMRFPTATDVYAWIVASSAPAGDRSWDSTRPADTGPHDVVIPADRCLRFTIHWDGRAADGKYLSRGDYNVYAELAAPWQGNGSVGVPFSIV